MRPPNNALWRGAALFAMAIHAVPAVASEPDETKAIRPTSAEPAADLPLAPARHIAFDTDQGTWMSLDISPDGSTLVFDHLGDLFLLPVGGGQAKRLLGGMAFEGQPRFSPDGKRIVFTSDRDGADNVWVVDSDGSHMHAITHEKNTLFTSPIFLPNGRQILVSRHTPAYYGAAFELWLYDIEGGEGVRLTKSHDNPDQPADQWRNALGAVSSPDGKSAYYARGLGQYNGLNVKLPIWQIVRQDLRTDQVDTVTASQGSAMRPLLSPDGRWLVFATREDQHTGLRIRELATGVERWLLRDIDRDDQETLGASSRDLVPGYAFSRDGRTIFAAYHGKIHRIDVASGAAHVIPMHVQVEQDMGPLLDFPARIDTGPVRARIAGDVALSPDGKDLITAMMASLYLASPEDGTTRRLLPEGMRGYEPAWSPDGRMVAYVDWSDTEGGALWVISADGKGRPRRITTAPAYYRQPVWSSDGSRILFIRAPWQTVRNAPTTDTATASFRLGWVPAKGGEFHDLGPAGQGMSPHFGSDPDRIYLSTGNGLESIDWDGRDRRVELEVTGKEIWGRTGINTPVTKLSPDGRFAASLFRRKLYVVPMAVHGKTPLTLNVESPALPIARLSSIGADQFSWSADGRMITWTVGATLFRRKVDTLKFEARLAADPAAERKALDEATVATPIIVEMPRAVPKGKLLIEHARIVTMRGDEVIEDGDLLIDGDRIAAVGPSGTLEASADASKLDAKGKTVIPGMIDLHAHTLSVARSALALPSYTLTAYLAYGVTTIRDPQTYTLDLFTYQDLIDAGITPGPRAYSTGPGISYTTDFQSVEDAIDTAIPYKRYYGVATIKSYLVGNRRQRQWMIEASKKLGLMPTTEGGSDMRLDLTHVLDGFSLEHNFPTTPLYDDVIQLVARSRAVYDPTLLMTYGGPSGDIYYWTRGNLHDDPKLRHFLPHDYVHQRTTGRVWIRDAENIVPSLATDAAEILRAGGRVTVGSHGDFLGIGYHQNLQALASGGMTPLEILRAATLSGAQAIGFGADLGSLEAGKLADLVILDANPLEDIRNTMTIHSVMKGGILYDGANLDETWPRKAAGPRFWWNLEQNAQH